MWKLRLLCLAVACLVSRPAVAQNPQAPETMALVGGVVWDGTGRPPRSGTTILIRGGLIQAVFPDASRPLPPGTTIDSLHGLYVLAGLIDTHVHIATDPDGEDSRPRTLARLRMALFGGVTTVREMAGDDRVLAGLARDAALGRIASPDIYYSALFAGPEFFADPRTQSSARGAIAGQTPWMRAVTDSTDLRQVVAEAKGTGATGIKLYAALDGQLARRITVEAHRQGFRVWAHAALRPATPAEVVSAGVDAVSHASLLLSALPKRQRDSLLGHPGKGEHLRLSSPALDSLFSLMRAQGTIFEPTLTVYADNPGILRLAGLVTRAAHAEGISIIAGTDTLGVPVPDSLPNLHGELARLVALGGLSPAEALAAATRNAAQTLGLQDSLGTVEPGKIANLVVLAGDPLRDIGNTRTVTLVVKRGRIYRRVDRNATAP